MASYRAINNGNFSNVAIWNVWNGSAWVSASVIPSSADDVWANNFTVTIDQNVTVLTIRNRVLGATVPGTGTVDNGGFQIINGNLTLTCLNNITNLMVINVDLLTINTISGVTTLNITAIWNANNNNQGRVITISGSSVVNIIGEFSCGGSNISACRTTSAATVNFVGNIRLSYSAAGSVQWDLASGTIFNLTGNLTVSTLGVTVISAAGIRLLGNGCTVNINGNLDWNVFNNTSSTNSGISLLSLNTTTSTLIINGYIVGGTIFNSQFAIGNPGNGTIIEHNGILYGGTGGSVGTGCPGIIHTNATVLCKLSGPFIYGNYGCPPFLGSRMTLIGNTSNYTEYASNSTNGAVFPTAAPTRMTMYSPNTLADSPIPANVRQGVTYALSSQTGTLIVPSPSNVRKDIPTDNTVGTADLSAADMWDYLTSSITTAGSIGKLVKDNLDVAVSTRLASASYVAPDNADIAAIKAVTDTLTDVATETTSLEIKDKTNLIPNNPASVESVGAIVASYNI